MTKINFQKDYISYLIAEMSDVNTPSSEIPIKLNIAPESDIGFLIIDKGDPVKEESFFYHRKDITDNTIVYVYGVNRSNPVIHDINSQVLLVNSIDALNYLADNSFEQMYIYKTSDKDIFIGGGVFFIDGLAVNIPNLNTNAGELNKSLTSDTINYIHIKDGDYYITTTKDNGLYQIGEIQVDASGVILSINRYNMFPISGKILDDNALAKLSGIESGAEVNVQSDYNETNTSSDAFIKNKPSLSGFEVLANKTNTLGSHSTSKYPTEKAVEDGLEAKLDKDGDKVLSDNNFTDYYKNKIGDKVDKVLGKELSTNDFTDLLKARLESIIDYKGIELLDGNNISISKIVDQNGKEIFTINSILGATGFIQNRIAAHINPVGTQGSGTKVTYDEWDKYLILSGSGLNGFDGKVTIPDGTIALEKIRVYVKNDGVGGTIRLQSLIKITGSTGGVTFKNTPIAFTRTLGTGDTYFDIDGSEVAGIDFTSSNELYFNITRDGRDGLSGDIDTIPNDIWVGGATVYFTNVNNNDTIQVIDNLLSTETLHALSANQGRVLKGLVDSKEEAFLKNTAFNKDFGILAGEVAEGNHSHQLADLSERSYNSLTDKPDLSELHSHSNKATLDKFGENGSGLPTYNGLDVDTTIAQRDVYDGLDSEDNTISLSAKQGKVLNDSKLNSINTKSEFNTAVSDSTGFAYTDVANTFTEKQTINTSPSDTLNDGILKIKANTHNDHQFNYRIGATDKNLHLDTIYGGVDKTIITYDRETGNTGIGIITPSEKLEVIGSGIIGKTRLDNAGSIEININGSGDRNSFIDFHSQDGTDRDARIIRSPGADGDLTIANNGAGGIVFNPDTGLNYFYGDIKNTGDIILSDLSKSIVFGWGQGKIYRSYENYTNVLNYYASDNDNYGVHKFLSEKTDDAIIKTLLELNGDNGNILFPSGNVGIGKTVPGDKLDISGGLRVKNASYKNESDLDNLIYGGFYNIDNPSNKPSGATSNWGYIEVIQHYNGSDTPDGNHIMQRWTDLSTNTVKVFTRIKSGGTWKDWVELT